MQIYLLAANLFTLAALFVGGSQLGKVRSNRLLPLFLLVIDRSLILVIFLSSAEGNQTEVRPVIAALEVLSSFCLVWTLLAPISHFSPPWSKLAWIGAGIALLLSFLSLWPIWPIPPQVHSLVIAIFSPLFLLVGLGQFHWVYLAPPLALALANFLSLLGLNNLSWLTTLLAYTFLINAVHWENVQAYRQTYKSRQEATENVVQEAIKLNQEQQRLLEVSRLISSVSDLSQSAEHIARTLADVTYSDQSAIFMLDVKQIGLVRLATVYNSRYALNITSRDQIVFALEDHLPLQDALEKQQQVLFSQKDVKDLRQLYALWYEDRTGPTLIQPLMVQGRAVGALLLGNPFSNRPIETGDTELCQDLSLQIATLVEYNRRYLELEWQAESMAATVQEQAVSAISSEPGAALPLAKGPVEGTLNRQKAVAKSGAVKARPANGTDLRQAEPVPEQAVQVKAHQAISEAISDGVVICDNLGRVRWANKAARQILGETGQMLIGQPIGAIYGEIDSQESFEALMVAFSRRNQPVPTFFETEDQTIQGRLIPWRNEEQEWLGFIGVFGDITPQVKAEKSRNDFIAALSRELRGPLTAVKGYSELIVNGAMANYGPEQIRVQQIIHSSAERMVEILDNAIRITARKRDQSIPRFEEVEVTKIVDEAVREAASLAELHELKLTREIKGELSPIVADPRHLRRILDNLLSNACRFTPPGGKVTVRAWIFEPQEFITKSGQFAQPELLISVADTGVGIPQTELKRIFDPFYQLDQPALEEVTGMGMGLTVVKELVEMHKGRVWVESIPGEGSLFQVALPMSQE